MQDNCKHNPAYNNKITTDHFNFECCRARSRSQVKAWQFLMPRVLMLIFILMFFFSFARAQIILNELMIDPDNDNTGEFIEIYNTSDSTIDLRYFFVCDEQDTDAVIPFPDSLLLPGYYGLILDPDYTGEYDGLIPDTIPLFSFTDARFGQYGISNSTSKKFSVLGPDLKVSDSYRTGTPEWPPAEHSIERKSFSDTLWCISLNPGGTPGKRNSTAIKKTDVDLDNLTCYANNNDLSVSFSIYNTGLERITDITYGYIVDMNVSCDCRLDTFLFSSSLPIMPGDSLCISKHSPIYSKGQVQITAFAAVEDLCDTLQTTYFIPIGQNDLIVTEFVCKTGDHFTSEYIEVFCKSNLPLQLNGMQIHDMTGYASVDSNVVLYPDSMIVLAQSASFHDDFPFVKNYIIPPAWRSLNNSEDIIRLQNPSGSTICNLQYNAVWNITSDCAMLLVDTSLNIANPNNWELSFRGSPGEYNHTEKQLRHLSACPEKSFFTPQDTFCVQVVNDGYFPVNECACSFTTPLSEQVVYLPCSNPGDTISLTIDTSGIFCEGTQLCRLECTSHFNLFLKYYYPYSQTPCLFNEILFDPVDTYGQAEFIELTTSKNPLDLEKWKIRINNSLLELGDSLTNTYTALCDKDDPLYGLSSSAVIRFSGVPALPNAGAELFLLDPMDRVMDHADLRDHDDIFCGKSLEKQFLSQSSSDPLIWMSSVSPDGMSPGKHNSITALPASRYAFDVYPRVFFPGRDDLLQLSVDSKDPISFCELLCFNAAGHCIHRHEQSTFDQSSFLYFWNVRTAHGTLLPRGLYLLLARLHDPQGQIFDLRETFFVR